MSHEYDSHEQLERCLRGKCVVAFQMQVTTRVDKQGVSQLAGCDLRFLDEGFIGGKLDLIEHNHGNPVNIQT